jgi:hypothetical protein
LNGEQERTDGLVGLPVRCRIPDGMTLFFEFTWAEMPGAIFTTLGVEPWGRFLTGFAELVCVVLLLSQRGGPLGALLALAAMGGAIVSHLTLL